MNAEGIESDRIEWIVTQAPRGQHPLGSHEVGVEIIMDVETTAWKKGGGKKYCNRNRH